MEREFNPATHLEEYDKTEQELGKVKADISGEKPKEELDALIAERDRLIADLEEQRGLAQEEAEADNKIVDLKRDHIQINTKGIEERKQRIEDLTKEIEEITGKKIKQEGEQPDIETLKQSNEAFLSETFKSWYGEIDAQKAKQEARFARPDMLDYKSLAQDINEQKFGEYTLNPDTQNMDFEKAKVFIPDLSQFVGRPRFEVMQYVIDTYSATHHIPGIEYWKWIIENKDKAPEVLKDTAKFKLFYFPGSVLRDGDGDWNWNVPGVNWRGVKFDRNADWLGDVWHADFRVVLLEKEKQRAEK